MNDWHYSFLGITFRLFVPRGSAFTLLFQVMEKFLWLGLDLERSISAPTLNDENVGTVYFEPGFDTVRTRWSN
jgi:hypothetical protein